MGHGYLTDESPMPFGVHYGKQMKEVPAQYLLWLWNKGISNIALYKYVLENLQVLQKEVEENSKGNS